MARMARVVVAGVPHHVTQRGNRRQTTFFEARQLGTPTTFFRRMSPGQAVKVARVHN